MEEQYWKKMINKKLLDNRFIYGLGITIIGIIFFFILGDSGPYFMRDSALFIDPNGATSQSYWLYTHFLMLCEFIFGQNNYLYVAYIVQALFAMFTSVLVTEYFRQYYDMTYISSLCVYLFTLLPYGYSLPENVVTHHIMTEALSIPLFHICLLFTYKSFLENKYWNMIVVIIMGILLTLSRSQLLLVIPIIVFLIVAIFTKCVIKKINEKLTLKLKIFIAGLIVISVVLVGNLVGIVFEKTTLGSQFITAITGRVMCLMEYEDREMFDGELQEIYDVLYKNADEGGHIEKYFRTDSWRSYDIAEHTNENTKECLPTIRAYYEENYFTNEFPEYKMKSYYDREYITKELLKNHYMEYFLMSIQLMTQSFVASVFIQPDSIRNLCYVIALFIYLGTFMGIYIAERKVKVEKKYIIPMLITLLFLVSNVVFTNIIFYGQQRYVIYTFGMFYVSWFIMILGIYRKRKELAVSE